MTEMRSLGSIAESLNVAKSRLSYAVQKIGLQERGRAGQVRLYSPDQVPAMLAALGTLRGYTRTATTDGVETGDST